MKIAHITSPNHWFTDQYGGTESVIYNLAKEQVAKGHTVFVFSAPPKIATDFRVVSFAKPLTAENWLVSWFINRITGAIHVCKSYKSIGSNFDIVHNHLSEEGIALSFLSELPSLTTLHGTPHTKLLQYSITKLFAIARKTKLVTLTRSAYMRFRRFYGDDLLGYVYHGIDVTKYPFITSSNKENDVELCFVGRIAPEKGVVKAIKVADLLHDRGKDVGLQIVGKYDPRNISYFRKVIFLSSKRSYVALRVNATRDEVARVVGNSDALLFPIQFEEPFGLVMIESMACGTPVIALARGSATEIIENNVTGFLCKNLKDMVAAIDKVVEIDRLNCRRRVESFFSTKSMYLKYLEMYNKVIGYEYDLSG